MQNNMSRQFRGRWFGALGKVSGGPGEHSRHPYPSEEGGGSGGTPTAESAGKLDEVDARVSARTKDLLGSHVGGVVSDVEADLGSGSSSGEQISSFAREEFPKAWSADVRAGKKLISIVSEELSEMERAAKSPKAKAQLAEARESLNQAKKENAAAAAKRPRPKTLGEVRQLEDSGRGAGVHSAEDAISSMENAADVERAAVTHAGKKSK